ncbi:IclR family transcriptional regulator [Streptomyces sp. NPDC004609]|uniref:IclR family transcriptional regulator n=1 Tax=Streptomyces sp. NPDC004609 TaxID=3364704 RepID=UPI0036C78083
MGSPSDSPQCTPAAPAAASPAPAGSQAVTRALGILHCFRDNGRGLSASDIARRTALSVSTAHRLARTLVSAGFLEQDPRTSRYSLGPAVTELGQLSYHQRGLHLTAPELADLAERTGATADLALRDGIHALILVGGSVRHDTGLGLRRPLHSTALGKILLAWPRDGEDAVGALPGLVAFTDRTIVEPEELRAELVRVREQGYAVNDGESALGVRTVAVPVFDRSGQARFSLALRADPAVITDGRLSWYVDQARACAAALEVLLLSPAERRDTSRHPV